MKLKYYMRGLGIGIILATLILTIGGRKVSLSDQEIKRQAAKLGMVMAEDTDNNLNTIINDKKPTETITPTQKPAADKAAALTPTLKPTMSPAPTRKAEKKPKQKTENNQKSTAKAQNKVTFTIKEGMSSCKIAKLLQKKGLIDDPDKFNAYIVKRGKEDVINVGTFEITGKPDYDTLLNMITE